MSASRRTDIPAFYGEWFIRRIRAGFCEVPDPYNPRRIPVVSLRPQDVSGIVFWTRYPASLLPHLPELRERGYRFLFLFTLLDYPRPLEPGLPPFANRLELFLRTADSLGPERTIWRYDPIVITGATDFDFHLAAFERLARLLERRTHRVIISIVDGYRKAKGRMDALAREHDIRLIEPDWMNPEADRFFRSLADCARSRGLAPASCCEKIPLERYGIEPRGCIDAASLRDALGLEIGDRKDPHQRAGCRCVPSRDIGVYDSCSFGCAYCYANRDFTLSRGRLRAHDPDMPALWKPVPDHRYV